MSEQTAESTAQEWPASGNGTAEPDSAAGDEGVAERPELLVGAAFVGGLALAFLLRRHGD